MLTKKDRIEHFKRECRNVHYYTEMILQCNERLEELANCMQGVSSPSIKDVIYENASDPYKTNKIYLMLEEEKVIKRRDSYIGAINYVNGKLMQIKDVTDKQMIEQVYVLGKSHNKTARDFHMDRATMYRRINRALGEIL